MEAGVKRFSIHERVMTASHEDIGRVGNQIGRELSVQYIVEGGFRRDSERLRVTVQLIQVKQSACSLPNSSVP